ncbi:MAG TPA: methyltransferase domain-containing protein [Spirochaetota bacterium]|nr:methyltransferase domain-containing protein [Spirochaetota bacterium]HRZ27486.1 methyltransferase domain-containing protein [Spirochaetota bacterium]HSA14212.1 methyltransferase domain-containing protein [Spirochaetota bacterium]
MGSGADPAKLSLTDIGSAMGFFLKAASDRGFGNVSGIEISRYAADYCRKEFGFEVENRALMPDGVMSEHDVITAWFFIEHCSDPCGVIMDIAANVRSGGVFAFSVPSVFGPLYWFNRKEWVRTHPADHRIDFSPGQLRLMMKMAGFRKTMIVPAGFHPERVLPADSLFFDVFSALYRTASGMLAFSDTLEVYALK